MLSTNEILVHQHGKHVKLGRDGLGLLLEFYVLAISKTISRWVIVLHDWEIRLPTLIWYLTQSHYPDTEDSSSCPILIILKVRLGSYTYQLYKSLVWLGQEQSFQFPACAARDIPIRPPRLNGHGLMGRAFASFQSWRLSWFRAWVKYLTHISHAATTLNNRWHWYV